MTLTLTGYTYSVYTRAVRMALHAGGMSYEYVELDPFEPANAPSLRALHPFGRVPVLADCLLWRMLDYFRLSPRGAAMIHARPALSNRSMALEDKPAVCATRPDLAHWPDPAQGKGALL